ncbi:methyl-accepting chemotaxis protein [Thalassospira lucentensis]|uniref:methyl-accepting chemotaxis protein n=1 Tax=Thalassospira lucentensis TaxID=168935 RepID=UPI003AA7AD32
MFGVGRDDTHIVDAIQKSQGTIEFTLDGKIITANENFLALMGYELSEVKGKHHSMFVAKDYVESSEYAEFWQRLGAGEFFTAEFHRVGKGGKDVWIQATYCPVLNRHGKPYKVFKFASDITADKRQKADYAGQIAAIGKSQAVIEFDMDGTIIDANDNFLNAMGYTLADLKGKNHSMCVMPEYAQSDEYAAFWAALRRGEYQTGEFKRMGRGGKEVWISASYNPVFDMNGRPFKVVKYATDVTKQVMTRHTAEELAEGSTASAEAVASASEEMLAAIQEISESMHRSQIAVNDIVAKSEMADGIRDELETTSEAMTGVVQIIRELADQVNLLALNATIEAARAGDAGKGFAVVAGEVKSLATQTAKATDQIETQINSMLGITQRVVESTRQISESANSVSDYVNTVASAFEEQTGVTNDISKNIQFVFNGIGELNRCVKSIAG